MYFVVAYLPCACTWLMLTWFHFRTARSRANTLTRVAVNVPSMRSASTCTPIRMVASPAPSLPIAAVDLQQPHLHRPRSPVPLPRHLMQFCTRSLLGGRSIAGKTSSSILTCSSCRFRRHLMKRMTTTMMMTLMTRTCRRSSDRLIDCSPRSPRILDREVCTRSRVRFCIVLVWSLA